MKQIFSHLSAVFATLFCLKLCNQIDWPMSWLVFPMYAVLGVLLFSSLAALAVIFYWIVCAERMAKGVGND